ncbi:MAG: hypothetical protein A2X57_06355 [Nitrospirae bacterium GWD2_57_8]|nr:MAG: hypothetical protein A2X57_06355 [Nitrospirae bacterium GWD2_57_8]
MTACISLPGSTAFAGEKPEVFVQMGHSKSIYSVAFSPDGRSVVSGSHDNTIKLWEESTGREIRTLQGHSLGVLSVVFSPDGRSVLSGSLDNTIKLWDVSTGREIRTFQGHSGSVSSVVFSPDGRSVLSGSWDKTLKLWDVSSGKELRTFQGHSESIYSVVFSPDGSSALSGSYDKTLKLWDVSTGREIRTFQGHSESVSSVVFSPDGRSALSGSADKSIKLWDLSAGKEVMTLKGHSGRVKSVTFSPDGRFVLSGSADTTIKLWDLSTGSAVSTMKGDQGGVSSVAFSRDGQYALSGGDVIVVRLWDLSTGSMVRTFQGHSYFADAVVFSPNGRHALSCDLDVMRIWDVSKGREVWSANERWVSSAAFSPDGRSVLTGSVGQTIKLWDLSTGKEVRTFKGHSSSVTSVVFSPDGRHFLSTAGYPDNSTKLWEVSTGRTVKTFNSFDVHFTRFSPDGRSVLSGSPDYTMKLWEVSTGSEVRTYKAYSSSNTSAVFSPDGRSVLSGSADNTIKLWDLATGTEVRTFTGHAGTVTSVAFSPDGRYVLSGSSDTTMILWNASSGEKARTFSGHANWVTSTVFSSDGRHALSGSMDHTIKLWDVSTGREIKTFYEETGVTLSVTFSPDGRHALSGHANGAAKIWNADTGNEIGALVGFDDGEWIVITPEGYFNASPNGAKNLNVRIGNKVYGIDQFYTKFYRPELVQLALAGKEVPKGDTFGDILVKNPAPIVRIASPVSGETIDTGSITLSLKIIDNGGGIGNVNIYLNGAQVANETRGVMVKGREAAHETMLTFIVPLLDGNNEIRAVAFNKENSMESNPALISVISKALLRKPDLYALVIGINEYKNKSISLTYAVPDALAFAETLKRAAAPLFDKTDIQTLTTPEATTKEAVTKAFEELRLKIKPNDLFVFYDASHGVVDVVNDEEQYFLLTSNVLLLSSRHIGEDAMGQKDLAKLIGNIPAQKKIVILDTCNAGKGGKELQIALLQQTRGLTESTAVKLLQRAIGSAVFSASSDTQQALEGYKGHGLFTYVLMEGLRGKADIKKDGFITVLGLADYVEEQVTKLSEEVFKRQQTPTIQTGANFPIGKVQ